MSHLELARTQMAFSLGFHIIFASLSMVLPFLMFLSYWRYLRRGDPLDLRLTRAWMRGSAILFATGAVSGTVLSFQLGLLWPGFMEHAGPIIGMPFSLEGAAFFLEAIFLGLFLYGWNRLPPRVHLFCALMVGVTGVASGVLVVAANGWMQAPTGFTWNGESATDIDPWKAMLNEAWPLQAAHMLVAAFQATAMAASGLHAFGLLRDPSSAFHRRALGYLVPVLVVSSLIQPVLGDLSARAIARRQPEKLAAAEAHFETGPRAGLWIGGWPDEESRTVKFGIEIPGALSLLAHGDPDAVVTGLDAFPPDERPPVLVTHLAFQVMVGLGVAMLLLSLVDLGARLRRRSMLDHRWFLKLLVLGTPAGFIALEAGWIVTEVGRQPWIIYRVMRTSEAVTPVPGLGWSLAFILGIYSILGILSFYLLSRWYRLESRRS